MRAVVCILIGYLVGSVPVGRIVVQAARPGLDLRQLGSGNSGTSNIFRNVGLRTAAVVGPLQFFQGLLAVMLGRWASLDPVAVAAVAVAVVAGNGWSIFLGFNGQRAVAVATGAVAGLGIVGLVALLLCYATGLLAGEIAIGVLAGFCVLPIVDGVVLGAADGIAALGLLGLVLLRRLEGIGADLASGDQEHLGALLAGRLLRDQRPGRPLVGPRSDG